MKRIGVFVFYDAKGIVDEYVEVLLSTITTQLEKLYIVINGIIEQDSKKILQKYTSNIFLRQNRGFDAGAYKDALLEFLKEEDWNFWDELLLFNDTFYGPFTQWESVFEYMKDETADFWGLSRYPSKNKLNETYHDYSDYIQSYFLVLKKKVLLSKCFWDFWRNLQYPCTRLAAKENFEISFSDCLEENGFKGRAYTDEFANSTPIECGRGLYIRYVYELLSERNFPVIKRSAYMVLNFLRVKKALDYIENNTNYNTKLIYDHLNRLEEEDRIKQVSPLRLRLFCQSHAKIFIYGHGNFGKNVAAFFEFKKWDYEGFLVSRKEDNEENVYEYGKITFGTEDGIVLALGKKAFDEVYPKLRGFPANNLFLLE